jgi:hypothetical protein
VAELVEVQGAVEGAGWGVEVVGDEPGPLGAGAGEQVVEELAAQASPPPVGVDGDPDDGELALQPLAGGFPTASRTRPYQPSAGTSRVGSP